MKGGYKMEGKQLTLSDPIFIEIRKQLETWRSADNKGKAIPKQIWGSAVKLAQKYNVSSVAKELRLSYSNLKRRTYPEQIQKRNKKIANAPFIELDLKGATSPQECILEMEDSRGAKMKIHLKGQHELDLAGLGRAFWGK